MKKALKTGYVTTVTIAVFYSLMSALFGYLGSSKGFLYGQYLVGYISRYWDPFIVGIIVISIFFLLKYSAPHFNPAILEKVWLESKFVDISAVTIVFFSVAILVCNVLGAELIERNNNGFVVLTPTLFLNIFVPFGMRGALIPLILISLVLFLLSGPVLAFIVILGTWLGKWLLWWFLRVLVLGSISEFNKIKHRFNN